MSFAYRVSVYRDSDTGISISPVTFLDIRQTMLRLNDLENDERRHIAAMVQKYDLPEAMTERIYNMPRMEALRYIVK